MFPSHREGLSKEDGPSLIVAGPAAVPVDPAADRGTNLVHKMDRAVRAGPCIPRVLNPVALLALADGPDSAPLGPVLGLALDLAPPGPESVVPAV
jgi:hypothetical protein